MNPGMGTWPIPWPVYRPSWVCLPSTRDSQLTTRLALQPAHSICRGVSQCGRIRKAEAIRHKLTRLPYLRTMNVFCTEMGGSCTLLSTPFYLITQIEENLSAV